MGTRKHLSLIIVPLTLAALACTCASQDLFSVPTATMPPSTPRPMVLIATPTPLPDEAIAELGAEDAWLINTYQKANPAVVYIQIMVDGHGTQLPLGTGSGFVIDTEGHIVTNAHVVEQADTVQVTFSYEGIVVDAQVLGQDPYSDLAVLKADVPSEQLVPLELVPALFPL